MSHFPGNLLSAIGEDLGPFAERALPVLLTTARVFIDKQIDIWAKVVKTTDQGGLSAGCNHQEKGGPAGSFLFYCGIG